MSKPLVIQVSPTKNKSTTHQITGPINPQTLNGLKSALEETCPGVLTLWAQEYAEEASHDDDYDFALEGNR